MPWSAQLGKDALTFTSMLLNWLLHYTDSPSSLVVDEFSGYSLVEGISAASGPEVCACLMELRCKKRPC